MPVIPAWHRHDEMLKKWDLVTVIRLRETPTSLRVAAVSQSWALSREANTHAWPLAYAYLSFLILRHVVTQPEGCSCVQDPWSTHPPASSQTTHEWKKELNEAFFLSMCPSACRCLFGVHVCMCFSAYMWLHEVFYVYMHRCVYLSMFDYASVCVCVYSCMCECIPMCAQLCM